MRILMGGAGAIGGYFGARLVEKGEDVTFLVREKRLQQLKSDGLVVKSVHGDVRINPKTILSGEEAGPFDVVIISTKAYHLDGAIEDIRPYVGEETMVLPLLNGIAHMEKLEAVFGEKAVLGGLCLIETTLDENGIVIQTSPVHDLVYGERNGEETGRIAALKEAFDGTKAVFRMAENINQEMWHKYLFISTFSGVTSLFRSPLGPIRDQEYGLHTIKKVLLEVSEIMRAVHAPIAEQVEEVLFERIKQLGYEMKSSLQRDMEKGLMVEADHFFGYLLTIAEKNQIKAPVIEAIFTNLKIYEQN